MYTTSKSNCYIWVGGLDKLVFGVFVYVKPYDNSSVSTLKKIES